MRRIWPNDGGGVVLDDQALETLYAYPADRRWLVVNFVASIDGAMEVDGRSAGLSNPADQRVFRLGSELADVILVGAGTVNAEKFRGRRADESAAERRRRHGLAPIPPIAVVTSGRSLSADSPVVVDALVPTIVITCAACPSTLREAWSQAGATVLLAGSDSVDLKKGVELLAAHGLGRIDCEGGPRLFGALLGAGLVDELRLTISPMLVAGSADRIALGDVAAPVAPQLASVLTDADTLLLRYLLPAGGP